MRVTLDYGKTGLDVELPDERVAGVLSLGTTSAVPNASAAVWEKLRRPTGCAPLADLARRKRTACILICDVTRPVPNKVLLPPILATLERAGVPREGITILVATGLHRPNEGDELIELVGADIARDYRCVNHFGQDQASHTFLGTTDANVPVWIDSRYVNAELKIATGLIEPHFMAGYSGGRKLICPGIAALETVRVWHSPRFLEHPLASSGQLQGNPVHEENTRIARMAGCDFIVNVTLDNNRNITSVVAGEMEAAFLEGVRFIERIVRAPITEPVDVVVTSSAGYPLDTTFYQTVKGMVGALPILKPGGTVVIAARVSQGIGSPEFQKLFTEYETLDSFMESILDRDCHTMDQWQLEELAKVRRHARVKFVSEGLTPDQTEKLFVESATTVEAAVLESLATYGPDAKIAVIPKGPYVMPVVAGTTRSDRYDGDFVGIR